MTAFMSPAGGGGSAIQAAMASRGISPVTTQVGAGNPMAQAAPLPLPTSQAMPQGTSIPSPTATTAVPQSESKIIIGALKNRLDAISKQEMPNQL